MANTIYDSFYSLGRPKERRGPLSTLHDAATRRSKFGAVLLAALLSTSGCATLLKADFDSFTVNEPPPFGALPGPPTGDSFVLGLGESNVFDGKSSNRLQFTANQLGTLLFTPKNPESQKNNYFVSFEGVLYTISDAANFGIAFFGETDQGQPALACNLNMNDPIGINIDGGSVSGIEVDLQSSGEDIGTLLLGYFHQVFVRINIPAKTCYFSIQQKNESVSTSAVSFSTPDFAKLTSLQFVISNQTGEEQTGYIVDDIKITAN